MCQEQEQSLRLCRLLRTRLVTDEGKRIGRVAEYQGFCLILRENVTKQDPIASSFYYDAMQLKHIIKYIDNVVVIC
jgi:hypothetical protein